MNKENYETLQGILEALMSVSTCGNDTITMANCLQALHSVIKSTKVDQPAASEGPIEPEIVK